jgi:hypothetical protein
MSNIQAAATQPTATSQQNTAKYGIASHLGHAVEDLGDHGMPAAPRHPLRLEAPLIESRGLVQSSVRAVNLCEVETRVGDVWVVGAQHGPSHRQRSVVDRLRVEQLASQKENLRQSLQGRIVLQSVEKCRSTAEARSQCR